MPFLNEGYIVERFLQKPKIIIVLVAVSGLILSSSVFSVLLTTQKHILQSGFKLDAEQRISAIETEVQNVVSKVNALKAFYEGSERVERDEYHRFADFILQGQNHIEALQWVPRVPKSWREVFEESARRDGVADFQFKEIKKEEDRYEIVPAGDREIYYPAYFIEPVKRHFHQLGFDMGTVPELQEMFRNARSTGSLSASSWVFLFDDVKAGFRLVAANPIYRNGAHIDPSRNELLGFVIGVLRVDRLFDTALRMFSPQGIDIYFSGVQSKAAESPIYHYMGMKNEGYRIANEKLKKVPFGLRETREISIADKKWNVKVVATSQYFPVRLMWMPWAALFVGLLMTYLLSTFIASVMSSKRALQSLNSTLRAEVRERQRAARLVRLSEARLRRIVDLVPHMIYAKDKEGHFLMVNKQVSLNYNKNIRDLVGVKQESVHPDSLQVQKYAHDDLKVIEQKMSMTIEEESFVDAQGGEHILRTTKIPYFWDEDIGFAVLAVSIDITGARQTEELRVSEERFRVLVEKSPDALFLVNKEGEFTDVNHKACTGLGYSREELLGCKIFDADPSKSLLEFKEIWQNLENGISITKESSYKKKDGNYFPVEERVSLIDIRNESYALFNVRDISDLKRMNDELKSANKFLDSIVENIPNMLFMKDAKNLRFVRLNKAGKELLGLEEKDFVGKNDYDFFPKEQADFFVKKDREVLDKGELMDIAEEPIFTSKGEKRFLHTKKIPIFDNKGRPIYLLGISEDITDQKIALSDLQQTHLAMENALDGIARIDKEGHYLSVNKAYADMLGYSIRELSGMKWDDTVHVQDKSKIKYLMSHVLRDRKIEGEIRALRKDHSVFYGQVVLIINNNPFDKACSHYCFFKDVTEKKYKQAIESKSELISMVSHELRTPLHSVREGISVMLDGLVGDITEEQREILMVNRTSLDRLARLVNSFLDFQRLEAGVVSFSNESANLNNLVHRAIEEIKPLAEHKGLQIKLVLQANIPEVFCDEDRVMQVLLNLLGNAVKFTTKGSITVETQTSLNEVGVFVTDTGVGIKKEDIPRLFKKFGQLEAGKILAPAGTGLGLAISRKIIEAQNGTLEVKSKFNVGSTFSFSLPISKESRSQLVGREAI